MAGYARWLIARGNVFAPSASAVAKLVDKLREERWVTAPGSPELARLRFSGKRAELARATGAYAVRTVPNAYGDDVAAKLAASTEAVPAALTREWLESPEREELRLVWPVSADRPLPLRHPLSREPEGAVAYQLELHRAPDFVYPVADEIGALPSVCRCGEDLEFEWDLDEVVPAFDASTGIYTECEECSRTFDPSKESAELANPFAGVSTTVPGGAAYRFALKVSAASVVEDPDLTFAPDLRALLEKEFGRAFYEVACRS